MPYLVNSDVSAPDPDGRIKKIIEEQIRRYFDNTMRSEEVELVFLKSVIYVEELVKEITRHMFEASKTSGLERHIKLLKLITGDERVSKSVELLERIKGFRDKMAHDLEYSLESDPNFNREFKLETTDSINKKKEKIAVYFKDIAHGFLYLKVGLDEFDNFVKFIK